MVQTGETGLFPLTPTAVGDLQDKGMPVAYPNPKAGPVLLLVDMCVLANNADPQLAQLLLSAPAQTNAAEAGKQIPTNRLAKMPAAMQQSLGNIDEPVRKVTVVDWTAINARCAQ